MKETTFGKKALVLACVLVGTLFLLCGAASGADDGSFIPFNQVYTENLFEYTTFGGWSNQVNISDYRDMSWFTQPERNSLFNSTEFLAFAPVDQYTSDLMGNALKNFLKKKA
ncbi:MAG: hypothetical protein LUQ25_09445 [Methanoregulaceae archaeon]|nr:hypothetical protein [Methanoregulaceae archaeon]